MLEILASLWADQNGQVINELEITKNEEDSYINSTACFDNCKAG